MMNGVHTDVSLPAPPPERTAEQLAQDYQRLLAQLRHLLRPVLEQMSAAPALSPEAVLAELLWSVVGQSDGAAPVHPALADLTTQERRIATLIVQGLSTETIAEQLYIAPTTVKVHRQRIRKKLGLTGRQQGLQHYLACQQ
jgi:DNA-binding NarL/FixJ family response regulator